MFTRICFLLIALLVIVVPALAETALQGGGPVPGGPVPGGPKPTLAHRFVDRFNAANTTHDGDLTLAQAEAAHMPMIASHFPQIDTGNRGYVTLADVRAFRQRMKADRQDAQPRR